MVRHWQLNVAEPEDIGHQNRADHQHPFLDRCDHCPRRKYRWAESVEHLKEQEQSIRTDIRSKYQTRHQRGRPTPISGKNLRYHSKNSDIGPEIGPNITAFWGYPFLATPNIGVCVPISEFFLRYHSRYTGFPLSCQSRYPGFPDITADIGSDMACDIRI